MTESYVVATADRCTVHPQHVMINQGRREHLYADLYQCGCGRRELGNRDEPRWATASAETIRADIRATMRFVY